MALDGLVEQSGEVSLSAESNVLAEVRSHTAFLGVGIGRAVESSGIALIKGDNLDEPRGDFFLFLCVLWLRLCRAGKQQGASEYNESKSSHSHSFFLSLVSQNGSGGRRRLEGKA